MDMLLPLGTNTFFTGQSVWRQILITAMLILVLTVLLWLCFGGKEYEYVGLKPLDPRIIHTREHSKDRIRSSRDGSIHVIGRKTDTDNASEGIVERTEEQGVQDTTQNITEELIDREYTRYSEENYPKILDTVIANIQERNTGSFKKFISEGENICRETLEILFRKPFPNCRPKFLTNPESGRRLELDCYNEELRLAVEYNGIQHYQWPNFTGQTYQMFINQIRRDILKVELCDRNGIYLITVPYNVPKKGIPRYIYYYLPDNLKRLICE